MSFNFPTIEKRSGREREREQQLALALALERERERERESRLVAQVSGRLR